MRYFAKISFHYSVCLALFTPPVPASHLLKCLKSERGHTQAWEQSSLYGV